MQSPGGGPGALYQPGTGTGFFQELVGMGPAAELPGEQPGALPEQILAFGFHG